MKIYSRLSFAAVLIGALRVKCNRIVLIIQKSTHFILTKEYAYYVNLFSFFVRFNV